MTIRHTCHDCGHPIPNGQAHIRSRRFLQIALCAACVRIRELIADSAERPHQRAA